MASPVLTRYPASRSEQHSNGIRGRYYEAIAVIGSLRPGAVTRRRHFHSSACRPASAANNAVDQFANVELPPDLGQASIQVYVPETGHTLRGYFLDYWRANGGKAIYGDPISEPFASADGLYSQAFEKGVFQFRLELVWTDAPSVTLMNLGDHALNDRLDTFRNDGRRGGGGGDRRTSSWKGVAPDGATATKAIADGGVWNETTGNTISGAFYGWYAQNEGPYYLGNPISQPVRDRGLLVQYFDGGILMQDSSRSHFPGLARQRDGQPPGDRYLPGRWQWTAGLRRIALLRDQQPEPDGRHGRDRKAVDRGQHLRAAPVCLSGRYADLHYAGQHRYPAEQHRTGCVSRSLQARKNGYGRHHRLERPGDRAR